MGCLKLPLEVLLDILEFTFAIEGGYPVLAALARTCRAFYGPAVSLLWRTQSSLGPLVLCFPPELLDIISGDGCRGSPIVTFAKSPRPQDWERPLRYAGFIREIGPTHRVHARAKRYILSPSVLETLVNLCPVPPLFQNLQNLNHAFISFPGWTFPRQITTDSQIALDARFLFELSNPAALQRLRFVFRTHRSKDVACALLTRLVEHYPMIESLDITNRPDRTDLQLFDYLIPFGSLQNITSFALSTLDFPLGSDLPPRMPADTLFPAVLELFLRCSSFSILQTLKVIHSPNLRTIRLGLSNHENPDELCAFITSRTAWRQSLESVSIASIAVSIQAAECLLSFGHLRHVSLNGPDLDDSILQRMAQAWHVLEHLDLAHREYPSPGPGRATLDSVASFSRLCPRLTRLRIEVDASLIPPLFSDSRTDGSQRDFSTGKTRDRLRLVILSSSEIRDPVAVAQFLSDLSARITLSIPAVSHDNTNRNRLSLWRRAVEIMGTRPTVSPNFEP